MFINRELTEGSENIILTIGNKEYLERIQQLESTKNDIQLKYVLNKSFFFLNCVPLICESDRTFLY